jgi:hypothetical protein
MLSIDYWGLHGVANGEPLAIVALVAIVAIVFGQRRR